jgi:hypothetical protein
VTDVLAVPVTMAWKVWGVALPMTADAEDGLMVTVEGGVRVFVDDPPPGPGLVTVIGTETVLEGTEIVAEICVGETGVAVRVVVPQVTIELSPGLVLETKLLPTSVMGKATMVPASCGVELVVATELSTGAGFTRLTVAGCCWVLAERPVAASETVTVMLADVELDGSPSWGAV